MKSALTAVALMPLRVGDIARELFLRATYKKPIRTVAKAVTIAPSKTQLAIQEMVEPALSEMCNIAIRMEDLASEASFVGIEINVDRELRSMLRKFGKARKACAHAVYVKHS